MFKSAIHILDDWHAGFQCWGMGGMRLWTGGLTWAVIWLACFSICRSSAERTAMTGL